MGKHGLDVNKGPERERLCVEMDNGEIRFGVGLSDNLPEVLQGVVEEVCSWATGGTERPILLNGTSTLSGVLQEDTNKANWLRFPDPWRSGLSVASPGHGAEGPHI